MRGGCAHVDEVARGLIEAFDQIKPSVPFVVRLDGTNDEEGRALLAEAELPNVHAEATMLGAAKRVVELAGASDGGAPEGETVPAGEGTETEMGAADTRAEAGT